jgi:CheY-like chemotaxis protein
MKPAQIVLIEDNPADVLLVRMALEENAIEHSLMRFEDGAEAVQALCAPAGREAVVPDAILLDLRMPRTDGFAVLVKLRQTPRLARVPIAILTSSRAQSDRQRAAIQGVRFIEKPSQLKDFLGSVAQAVKEMLGASGGTAGAC